MRDTAAMASYAIDLNGSGEIYLWRRVAQSRRVLDKEDRLAELLVDAGKSVHAAKIQ
jgi:hypothetical protein